MDVAIQRRNAEALTGIEWFWTNGPVRERHTEFLRRACGWCEDEEIRALLLRLRPSLPVREGTLFPSLMDWLALSSALGLEGEILAWFDARVAEGDLPLPELSRLVRAVLRRGRLSDCLAFREPLQAVLDGVTELRQLLEFFGESVHASDLEEVDVDIALWRRVAEAERPEQLDAIDAVIDVCERGVQVRAWLGRPVDDLLKARTNSCLD